MHTLPLFPALVQDAHDPKGKVRLKLQDHRIRSQARFSTCGRYRFSLERRWDQKDFGSGGACLFLMMNPSTADEHADDPTVRRCYGFAKDWGYQALVVCNIFAYRATFPEMLLETENPVGRGNDEEILQQVNKAGITIVAFGVPPKSLQGRGSEVAALLKPYNVFCLKTTKSGAPGHPLYIAKTTQPIPWAP